MSNRTIRNTGVSSDAIPKVGHTATEVPSGPIWTRGQVCEALTTLYLRLAGYFTTGFVAHSSIWGQTLSDIDCLAVRHPLHSHPDILVDPPAFLDLRSPETDVILCEVKSDPEQAHFNETWKVDSNVIKAALRWVGLFSDEAISEILPKVRPLLEKTVSRECALAGISSSSCRIRFLLSCPPANNLQVNGRWVLTSEEIFRYALDCFNPPVHRSSCSTRYNFQIWGNWLSPIVRYLKGLSNGESATLDGLYTCLGCHAE